MIKKKVADNLYVYTKDSGKSYYVFRGTISGKHVDRSLSSIDSMTLKEAKRAVGALLNTEIEETSKDTFGQLFPIFLESIAKLKMWKNRRSYDQWNNSIRTYAYPVLEDKPVAKVDRKDILAVLEPIWFNKTETASRIQQRLEEAFNWFITRDYMKGYNPASWRGNLELFLPSKGKVKRVEHQTAPTLEELKKVVSYCLSHPSPVSGCILFVIATVCRVTEARIATRKEITGDVWTIPVEHQKVSKQTAQRVPLSTLAFAALDMANGEEYLFEGTTAKKVLALDSPRLKMVSICPRPDGKQITIHGIRSTFRDWCAENGVPDAEAEKALSHVWGDATTGAYYRSDLLDKRRELMERWSDFLTSDE